MSEFKIEKNVPLPTSHSYEWDKLEIGDSVFLKDGEHAKYAATSAHNFARRQYPSWKFVVRTVPGGKRIWRIR
jgi:hypothetical protein